MAFVSVPFTVDADTLADDAIDDLRTSILGWEPADGNLEVWVIQAIARQVAELTAVAADVPDAIFSAFGKKIYGLPQGTGVQATITTFWTASDSAGYTIPAGTQVAYRLTGDDLIVFEVLADTTIIAGSSTLGGVVLTATSVGIAWNGVPNSTTLELVDALSWVDSVVSSSASSGGVNAETDAAYQARLAAELTLSSPRPILPADFAILARNVTGVYRALAINGYDPGTDEVQQVAITGAPAGGTFTLTYSGQTTAAIAYSAAASAVQSALEALSNIAVGDVACTGGPLPGTPVLVEFTGALAVTDVAAMTHTDSLTGGSSPAVAVTTPTPGVAPSSNNERYVTVVPIDSTGVAVSPTIRAAVVTYLDGLREITFVVKATTPTSTTVNVAYTVKVATGYVAGDVKTACDAAVTAYLSPAVWGGGGQTPPVWNSGENTVRVGELYAALYAVLGVQYVTALTVNSGMSDVTLTGAAPLPAIGTITGTTI